MSPSPAHRIVSFPAESSRRAASSQGGDSSGQAEPFGQAESSQGEPARLLRTARLIAALEEDSSGRQPLTFPCTPQPDSTDAPDARAIPGIGHVFLETISEPANCLGYARVNLGARTAELTTVPGHRNVAVELAAAVLDRFGITDFWVRGRRSAAAVLDGEVVRHLDLMSRRISPATAPAPLPADIRIRPFDPDLDPKPWLALNREVFSDLPDQAGLTRDDLIDLLKAEWFDPDGFLVAAAQPRSPTTPGPELLGYHWTKVTPGERVNHRVSGEVFTLGVLQDRAGTGLAAALLDAGTHHLARKGVVRSHLYVESTNRRAHSFYLSHGYHDIDADQLLRVRN